MRRTAGRSTQRSGVAATVGTAVVTATMVVAFPVVVWFLVGDRSTVPPGVRPDYDVRPPALSAEATTVLGVSAIVVFVAALAGWFTVGSVSAVARRGEGSMNGSVVLLALLLPAGAIVAFAWRVMTAGTVGAGGAGFAQLFLLPLAGILVVIAIVYGLTLVRRR